MTTSPFPPIRWPRTFPLVLIDFDARTVRRYEGRKCTGTYVMDEMPSAREIEAVRVPPPPSRPNRPPRRYA
jgi:hypothetical protein